MHGTASVGDLGETCSDCARLSCMALAPKGLLTSSNCSNAALRSVSARSALSEIRHLAKTARADEQLDRQACADCRWCCLIGSCTAELWDLCRHQTGWVWEHCSRLSQRSGGT